MNAGEPNQPNDDAQHEFVESLLTSMFGVDNKRAQDLVDQGLERLEPRETPLIRSRLFSKWLGIALAASALIWASVYFPGFKVAQPAMAAVDRSIDRALEDVGRRYTVTSRIRNPEGNSITKKLELFVRGGQRFAMHIKGPMNLASTWIGSSHGEAWVVPPIGPVIEGKQEHLIRWAANRDDLATPYLHISTILERMRNRYEFESVEKLELETAAGNVVCNRIVGVSDVSSNELPRRIELWADAETGVAQKVSVFWELNERQVGRDLLTVEFQESVELDDHFFTAAAHDKRGRKRIKFDASRLQN